MRTGVRAALDLFVESARSAFGPELDALKGWVDSAPPGPADP